MPQAAGTSILSATQFYSTSSVQGPESLGEFHFSQIGQGFRYVKAGGSNLVIGNLLQNAAEQTNFKDMAVQAAVATSVAPSGNGGYPIPVTLGGTATTSSSQFAGGTLTISVTPGLGQTFTILSNDVQATTNGTCNFYVLEQPLVALTTSSKASVYPSNYNGVIQMPTAHTGIAVGGAVTAIAASNFGYIQTLGPGSVLSDATVTAAATMGLSASVTTAGCVTKAVNQDAQVGVSLSTVSVSAECEGIFWRCF